MNRRVIIDTDTGSDDAIALIMAMHYPNVDIEGITTVSGNVSVEQASLNARYTVECCNRNIPVFNGCKKPLLREPSHAHWFHGEDGMGNMNYPAPELAVEKEHAVPYLINAFRDNPEQIELVTLGPLTNIATALKQEPELAQWVKHCYVMGGAACCEGNVTPAAEYNIWCDPEAAEIVFNSGMSITMIG